MEMYQGYEQQTAHAAVRREHVKIAIWKTVAAATVVLVLGFMIKGGHTGLAWAAEPGSATEAIKGTVDEVLNILADADLKKPERKADRLTKLEKVIGERFDYAEMGMRTLGRHWKELSDPQRQEFIALFQQFLSNTYAGNVDGYSGEQVQYLQERRKGEFAEVQTKVVSSKVQVPLDYRLLKKSNGWYVYDVVIDGVSLVKNFRGQFERIIASSSYDGLFKKLRSKTNPTSPSS